jgi:hypothetical protein
MRNIVFEYQDGHGDHNLKKEIREFEDDATGDDIQEEFEEWVWEFIADRVAWYEEDSE